MHLEIDRLRSSRRAAYRPGSRPNGTASRRRRPSKGRQATQHTSRLSRPYAGSCRRHPAADGCLSRMNIIARAYISLENNFSGDHDQDPHSNEVPSGSTVSRPRVRDEARSVGEHIPEGADIPGFRWDGCPKQAATCRLYGRSGVGPPRVPEAGDRHLRCLVAGPLHHEH
jgi:hypothetical protein